MGTQGKGPVKGTAETFIILTRQTGDQIKMQVHIAEGKKAAKIFLHFGQIRFSGHRRQGIFPKALQAYLQLKKSGRCPGQKIQAILPE